MYLHRRTWATGSRGSRPGCASAARRSTPRTASSATSSRTSTDFFAFWKELQDKGLTPPADVQAQDARRQDGRRRCSSPASRSSASATRTSSSRYQKLVPDEIDITMIPNQKGGKPGQYLKPSMLLSIAETSGDKDAAAELMNFFITDHGGQRHPADRARRLGRPGGPRERSCRACRPTEKKIIDYLDIVATSSARCRRRRRRTPASSTARCARPGTRSPSSKVDRRRTAPRSTTTTPWRSSRAPERRWPRVAGDRQPGGARRPRSATACGAAWRRNGAGLSLPAALAHRLLRPDARADAGLALPLLHRLRPADPAALGRARRTTSTPSSGPAALRSALARHLHLRALVGAAEARRRARRSPWCSTAASAASASTARSSTCRRCSAPRSPSPCSGGRSSARDGLVNQLLALVGIHGPAWVSHPDYALSTLVVLADLAVRLADDHLPRRPAPDPAGPLRGRLDGRRLAAGGSSARSPCRSSRR